MTAESETPSSSSRLRFFYIKSRAFRVVHADGAIGGVTPRGLIHAAFYSERAAIPQETEVEVSPTGSLGARVNQVGKDGIVRELDVDIMMSKRAARELRDWLTEKLSEIERIEEEVKASEAKK